MLLAIVSTAVLAAAVGCNDAAQEEATDPPLRVGDGAAVCAPGAGGAGSGDAPDEEPIVIGTGTDDSAVLAGAGDTSAVIAALVDACNRSGGIAGRPVELRRYDGPPSRAEELMRRACGDEVLLLVGSSFGADGAQESTRLGCDLPTVPSITTDATVANGASSFAPIPDPADLASMADAILLARRSDGAGVAAVVVVPADAAGRDAGIRFRAAAAGSGVTFAAPDSIEYQPDQQRDWAAELAAARRSGAGLVVWTGRCDAELRALLAANRSGGTDLDVYAPNADATCQGEDDDGSLDGLLLTSLVDPDSEAASGLSDLLDRSGLELSAAAARAASAFMLFARAAQGCGADGAAVERECVVQELAATQEWTAGGLHAATDPGGNRPSECTSLWQVVDGAVQRVDPADGGQPFVCDPDAVVPVFTTAGREAQLDEDRIARRHTP